jgi:hypothetical protein
MSPHYVFPEIDLQADAAPVYATPPPDWAHDDERLPELAARFGVKGQARRVKEHWFAEAGGNRLEVFLASGSLRWTAGSRQGHIPQDSGHLPDDEAAIKQAEAFVHGPRRAIHLPDHLAAVALGEGVVRRLPFEDQAAELAGVSHTEVSRQVDDEAPGLPYPIAAHVDYRFRLGSIPVVGPGAKMRVSFGVDGKISDALKFWRDPHGRSAPRPVLSIGAIEGGLAKDPAFAHLDQKSVVTYSRIYLAHYAAPPGLVQRLLVPVLVCEGSAATPALPDDPFARYLVAVQLSGEEQKVLGPEVARQLYRVG